MKLSKNTIQRSESPEIFATHVFVVQATHAYGAAKCTVRFSVSDGEGIGTKQNFLPIMHSQSPLVIVISVLAQAVIWEVQNSAKSFHIKNETEFLLDHAHVESFRVCWAAVFPRAR